VTRNWDPAAVMAFAARSVSFPNRQRGVLTAFSFAIAFGSTGCAQLLGADEYSKARTDAAAIDGATVLGHADGTAADSDGPDAASTESAVSADPLFEFKPQSAECRACLEEHCTVQQKAYEADSRCAEYLEVALPPQESIVDYDLWQLFSDSAWDFDDGQRDVWPLGDLLDCQHRSCLSACDFGRDFSCVGTFEWRASYPATTNVRLGLVDLRKLPERLSGWTVHACSSQDLACRAPLGTALSNARGGVNISIDLRRALPLAEFDGFFLAEGGPDYFPALLRFSRPLLEGEYSRNTIASRETVLDVLGGMHSAVDPASTGIVTIVPFDCAYRQAKRVKAELFVAMETAFRRCDECQISYLNPLLPDPTLEDFSAPGPSTATVANVPPGNVFVVMRDTATSTVLGGLLLPVQADRYHLVYLYPASKEQLARLPVEVR
jgi:hypothetical protein